MARTHIAFARHRLFTQGFGVKRGNGLLLRHIVKRGLRVFFYAEIGRGFLLGQPLPCGARVLLRLLGKLLRVLGDGLRFLRATLGRRSGPKTTRATTPDNSISVKLKSNMIRLVYRFFVR